MMDITAGRYFRGFLASDTLHTTDTAIPLFDQNGNSITLAAGERLIIYECFVSNGATAAKYTIYADTNGNGSYDAGEELIVAGLGVNGVTAFPQAQGYVASRLTTIIAATNKLRATASADSVGSSITIVGHVIKS